MFEKETRIEKKIKLSVQNALFNFGNLFLFSLCKWRKQNKKSIFSNKQKEFFICLLWFKKRENYEIENIIYSVDSVSHIEIKLFMNL